MVTPKAVADVMGTSVTQGDTCFFADGEESALWRIGEEDWQVVISVRAEMRVAELEGYLARMALLAPQQICVILELPRLSSGTISQLHAYLPQVQRIQSTALVIFSRQGGRYAWFPSLRSPVVIKDRSRGSAEKLENLSYTAINEWVLKVLLFQDGHESYWGGPREALHSVHDLAHASGVSYTTASRLWRTLVQKGWAPKDRTLGLLITALRELTSDWLSEARKRPHDDIPVRPLYGSATSFASLIESKYHDDELAAPLNLQRPRWAVCGWSACRAYDVLHVTGGKPDWVCVGQKDVNTIMRAWHLQPCDQRDAMFFVRSMKKTSPAFWGGMQVVHGMPCVDLWQAALDVSSDPARGFEQAEHVTRTLFDERLI